MHSVPRCLDSQQEKLQGVAFLPWATTLVTFYRSPFWLSDRSQQNSSPYVGHSQYCHSTVSDQRKVMILLVWHAASGPAATSQSLKTKDQLDKIARGKKEKILQAYPVASRPTAIIQPSETSSHRTTPCEVSIRYAAYSTTAPVVRPSMTAK